MIKNCSFIGGGFPENKTCLEFMKNGFVKIFTPGTGNHGDMLSFGLTPLSFCLRLAVQKWLFHKPIHDGGSKGLQLIMFN